MGDKETPNYFYKYRSLSGVNKERTLLSIVHGILWFSKPSDFKDKNDCKIPVSFDTTPEKFRAKASTALTTVIPHLSGSEKAALINHAIENRYYADPGRIHSFRNWHENHVAQRGVLSLCSTNVSDRMWREYADDYRGCCLEFRKSQKGMFANVEKAHYEEKLPTVNNYEASHIEMNDTIMLTKLEEYKFENEWRIWNSRGPGYWKYNAGNLTGLIFGYLISKEDKKLLAYLLKRSHPAAKLYETIETGSSLEIITSSEELND